MSSTYFLLYLAHDWFCFYRFSAFRGEFNENDLASGFPDGLRHFNSTDHGDHHDNVEQSEKGNANASLGVVWYHVGGGNWRFLYCRKIGSTQIDFLVFVVIYFVFEPFENRMDSDPSRL